MDDIIYLEPDEEITSVIDKIKKAPSQNLGLVIPRDATLLQSVVNLRLLSREANTLGKKISVVTSDKIGRNLAAQIGLPVFASIEEQKPIFSPRLPEISNDEVLEIDPPGEQPNQKDDNIPGVKVQHYESRQSQVQSHPVSWQRHGKPILKEKFSSASSPVSASNSVQQLLSKKNTDYKKIHKILWPVLSILILLAAATIFLLLPKATVTVFVPSTDLKKTLSLAISDQVTVSNIEQNVFPGILVEATGEKKAKFIATGKKDIGVKTKGTISILNNLDSNSHSFPAGTKVLSTGKTFLTQSAVAVPGAGVQGGAVVPGTVKVVIEAQDPGSEYNVKAGRFTILSLSAAQQTGIYGQSTVDLTGGESRQVQVVSQKDYDEAKNSLIKDLTESVSQDLQKKVGEKKLLEKALVTPDPEITSSVKVDEEAADFEMTVKVKNQAVVFEWDDLEAFVVKMVGKDLSSDKMITIANPEDLSLAVAKTAYDKGQMDLTVNVLAKVSDKIATDKIAQSILGKKVTEVSAIVQGLGSADRVEVELKPSWWLKRIPDLERNINVKTEYFKSEKSE